MFEYIEYVKEKKVKLAAAMDIEQVSEECVSENLSMEDPGPKHVGQVHHRKVLMHRN